MVRSVLAAALALPLAACVTAPAPVAPVTVRIVGLNDFHGNLEPIRRPVTLVEQDGTEREVQAGGVAHLASAVAAVRAKAEHSLVIAAGDLIGASPLESSYFLDEPTIGAMNRLGLDFNALGNHEFDRGWRELKRLAEGGCEKLALREPCAVEPDFSGARFAFLAANVLMPTGETLFAPYAIRRFGTGAQEVSVGVIGLTLKDTPSLVTPEGVAGLTFAEEAATINAAVEALEAQGADAIVVAIHQGLYTKVGYNDKSCGGVSGPLIDILKQSDPRVDLVVSGHTHWAYVCDFAAIDPARGFTVTSAGYGGTMLTDIALEIDPASGQARVVGANNVVVSSAEAVMAADPAIAAYVARYSEAAGAAKNRPIGRISGAAIKPPRADVETPLGNAIADAQLAATRDAGAQIAFMNNSGIRAAIDPGSDGTVSFGDAYAVQPFGNTLVTRSYTGAQLLALLEQQFDGEGFVQTFSVSEGFSFRYDRNRPEGARVTAASLNGAPIDPAASYRVTMNSFLAGGGDGFTIFPQGTGEVIGPLDLDAFEAWVAAVPVRAMPATGRIEDATGG